MTASARHSSEMRRGWPVVATATLGVTIGVAGVPFYAIGSFIGPMEEALGWSRMATASAMMFLAIGLVIGSPIAGRLSDRLGPAPVIIVSALLLALCLFGLATVGDSQPVFLGLYGAMGLLGAGTGPVVYTRSIGRRFKAQRGLAIGAVLTGTGIAGIFTPLIVQRLVEIGDWRTAWFGLATLTLLSLPVVLIGLRSKEASTAATAFPAGAEALSGSTLQEGLRDRRFWLLATSVFIFAIFMAGIAVHMIPMLTDEGLAPEQAAAVAALVGAAVIVSRLGIGLLVDRFFAPFVAFGLFAVTAAGCALFLLGAPPVLLAVTVGMALGAEIDLIAYLVTRYFGLRSYGAIYGTLYAIYMTGGAVSPSLIAFLHDRSGSYELGLTGASIGLAIVALMFLLLGRYPETFGRVSGQERVRHAA